MACHILGEGIIICMKLERSGGDLPWMVTAKLDKKVVFEVKLQTISMSKNGKGWSCYMAQMKTDSGAFEDDGDHEVPFWAMDEFADAIEDAPDKGWYELTYTRSEDANGQNVATFRGD